MFTETIQKVKTAVQTFIDEKIEAAALYFFDHKKKVLLADAIVSLLAYLLGAGQWALWAHILLLQNWSFTYVSRARNSGSLSRHLYAGTLSNGVWWLSQIIIFSTLYKFISGGAGIKAALLTGLFYTAFTLTGSISAHAQALRNEKGKAAVGASKKYVQVTPEDWAAVQAVVADFNRVRETADNAYGIAIGIVPDSGMSATKVGNETVYSGITNEPK